jgi:hypothetical protein
MTGFKTILVGERVLVWNERGEAQAIDGPRRIFVFRGRVQPLKRYAAGPEEYLAVRRHDGTTEHTPGPVALWFNPIEHAEIEVRPAMKVDANEALVVYRRGDEGAVARRVVRGPALFVCAASEWIHRFSWHGSDARHGGRKVPSALQFEKLRVIPDQMYFDVENVRTNDDALLTVQLMVFFELADIGRMLDQTHDPVADFINALSADVIDFVGALDFDAFKARTEALNDMGTYPQLAQRAERIGYRVNKVVYRGYYANDKLQAMHDNAIECRTRLRLEAETERQGQELADLKLAREADRAAQRQGMEEAEARHKNRIVGLAHEAELGRRETEQRQALEAQRRDDDWAIEARRRKDQAELDNQRAAHEEQIGYFARMRELQIDLTRYLVAQYQNPDKVIRIDNGREAQLHLHEN